MKRRGTTVTENLGAPIAKSTTAASPLSTLNVLLAITIIYIPYQIHFPLVFDIKGLNFLNLLFVIIVIAVAARKTRTISPVPLKWHFLFFFCALTWAFLIGQAYDSSTLGDDLTVLKNDIFNMLFFFLFYYAVRDVQSIRLLLWTMLFVTFVVSVHVWRQALDYGIDTYMESRRAAGPFSRDSSGSNMAAAYFVIFVPLFFTVALVCKSRPLFRLISLACGFLGVLGSLFTYSRQAYFIFPALFAIQTIRRSIFLASLLGIAILGYEVWVPTSVLQRIQVTEQTTTGGEKKLDASTESRFVLWEGAKALIAERPWGVGLNHFRREVGRHLPGNLRNYDVHNGFLLIATEMGIVGLISLLVLLFGLFRLGRGVERLDRSEDSTLLGNAYAIALFGVGLSNLFGSRIFDGAVMGDFWILSGLVARYYTLKMETLTGSAEE